MKYAKIKKAAWQYAVKHGCKPKEALAHVLPVPYTAKHSNQRPVTNKMRASRVAKIERRLP